MAGTEVTSTTTRKSNRKSSELMLIPESVLKKRHDLDDLKRKRAANEALLPKAKKRSDGKGKTQFYVKKPETFLARGRSRLNHSRRFKRVQEKGMQKRASNKKEMKVKTLYEGGDDDDEEEETTTVSYQSNSVGAKLVLVIRIRDDVGTPQRIKSLLSNKLKLPVLHQARLIKYTPKMQRILHTVEPFVLYGPPTQAVIADLLERRGHGKIDDERVPLSDNTIVERALGESHGLLCVEDLVHELYTVGEAFDAITDFLWNFPLADSKTEFERRTLKFKDGKDYGDKGDEINDYIRQVL